MTTYFVLKFLHIIGAAVLLGTGAGIAFFMLMAHRTGDAATIAATARIVVIADYLFTATAVVPQPVTGVLLAREAGYPLRKAGSCLSMALYLVTGAFWLPVVWMQTKHARSCRRGGRGRRAAAGGLSQACSGSGSPSAFPPSRR